MNREKFLELEYQTLREEIAHNKDHLFKLAGFGFIGLPSAYYLAHISKSLQGFQLWVLLLPLLIWVIALFYISKSRAITRCGTYIKDKIEAHIKENSESKIGWEHWLSEDQDRRWVDKFFAISFYLLLGTYYVASTYLAALTADTTFGIVGHALTWGVYGAVGIIMVWFLVTNYKGIVETG